MPGEGERGAGIVQRLGSGQGRRLLIERDSAAQDERVGVAQAHAAGPGKGWGGLVDTPPTSPSTPKLHKPFKGSENA